MTQGQRKAGKTSLRPCRRSPIPIDFVYDDTLDEFSIEKFDSNEDLVAHLQKGLTKSDLYRNKNRQINIYDLFGQIKPENFYQNEITG